MTIDLAGRLDVDPQVALRPEPFGALAYHYGNRRLVFLKHPTSWPWCAELAAAPSLRPTLAACGVAERRWPRVRRRARPPRPSRRWSVSR